MKSQLLVFLLCTVCWLTGAYAQPTPTADAYTNTADPATNYGAKTLLDVESASQTTYIRFALSSLPADYGSTNITKATLKLCVNSVTAASFRSYSLLSRRFFVFASRSRLSILP